MNAKVYIGCIPKHVYMAEDITEPIDETIVEETPQVEEKTVTPIPEPVVATPPLETAAHITFDAAPQISAVDEAYGRLR